MKAMIFAAGLGKRLRPLTEDRPKALVEIAGKSLLEWNILRLQAQDVQQIVVNIHHHADQVRAFLEEQFPNVLISDESEELLDTGGALLKAAPLLEGEEPILLYNVDVLSNIDISTFLAYHQSRGGLATLAVRDRESDRKLLLSEEDGLFCGWEDKAIELKRVSRRQRSFLERAFSGIHLIEPTLLQKIKEEGTFSIIHLYLRLAKIADIYGYEHNEDQWFDVGTAERLEQAAQAWQELDYEQAAAAL